MAIGDGEEEGGAAASNLSPRLIRLRTGMREFFTFIMFLFCGESGF